MVIDVTGNTVYSTELIGSESIKVVDVSKFATGLYLYQIKSKGATIGSGKIAITN